MDSFAAAGQAHLPSGTIGCAAPGCLSCTAGTKPHSLITLVADCMAVRALQVHARCWQQLLLNNAIDVRCLSIWCCEWWHCAYCSVSPFALSGKVTELQCLRCTSDTACHY